MKIIKINENGKKYINEFYYNYKRKVRKKKL